MTGRQTQPGELSTATNLDPGETRCTWNAADGKRVLFATLYTQPMDPREKFEALRTGLFYDEDAPSPGVGEESFYRLAGHGDLASIVFIDGGSTVHLRLGNPDDTPASTEREAEGREQLVELARDVTSADDRQSRRRRPPGLCWPPFSRRRLSSSLTESPSVWAPSSCDDARRPRCGIGGTSGTCGTWGAPGTGGWYEAAS